MTKSNQKNKNKNPFEENKHEIIYNLINCSIAGGLVFLGSLTSGGITREGLFFSVVASLIVFITKFSNYWATQESEYKKNLFNFVGA